MLPKVPGFPGYNEGEEGCEREADNAAQVDPDARTMKKNVNFTGTIIVPNMLLASEDIKQKQNERTKMLTS